MTHHPVAPTRAAHAAALTEAVLTDASATAAVGALVRLAVERTGADAAQVSMLTDGVVSLCPTGTVGGLVTPGSHLPFEESLCAYALRTNGILAIPDARADQRVASIAAVVDGHVGAYLGAPVRTADGDMIGVLCVFHRRTRTWTSAHQAELTRLAGHVAEELTRQPTVAGARD